MKMSMYTHLYKNAEGTGIRLKDPSQTFRNRAETSTFTYRVALCLAQNLQNPRLYSRLQKAGRNMDLCWLFLFGLGLEDSHFYCNLWLWNAGGPITSLDWLVESEQRIQDRFYIRKSHTLNPDPRVCRKSPPIFLCRSSTD